MGLSKRLPLLALVIALAASSSRAAAQSTPETATAPSAGDLATARTALREGQALRETGDLDGSLSRLVTAWELVQTPVTGFEVGKAYMLKGKILQARESFLKVARMPLAVEESERSASARTEAARLAADLEPRIPTLRLSLVLPPGASAKVLVDDEDVTLAPGEPAPRRVDPGAHVVLAKAGDGPELRVPVTVAEGETKDVEIAPTWVVPKAPPKPQTGPIVVKTTNSLVFVGFAGASASLVLAGVSTLLAIENTNRAEGACGTSYCPPDVLRDDANVARFWGAMAVVSVVSTAVFLSVGIVASSFPAQQKIGGVAVSPAIGPSGAGMVGTF